MLCNGNFIMLCYYIMYSKLSQAEYEQIITKVGRKYLPEHLQNEKKKPKLTLKQLFFLKGKGK